MKMDSPNIEIERVDRLLQFILATAGQEDFGSRELGPIHLIKYIYLADLEHAKQHSGETYTNLPWKFHHFGPWSTEAFSRIEPALHSVGADKKIIELHKPEYEREFVRWSVIDDNLYERLERELPIVVVGPIQKYVHQFGAVTEDLLHFVYKTLPMLRAKPGEYLDFKPPCFYDSDGNLEAAPQPNAKRLTAKQQKKRKAALEALRSKVRKKLEEKKKKPKLARSFEAPIYDDIYFEGLKALDACAGESIIETHGTLTFSDGIWKSKARFDPDVP